MEKLRLLGAGVLVVHVVFWLVLSVSDGDAVELVLFALVPGVLGVAVWTGAAPEAALWVLGLIGIPLFFVGGLIGGLSAGEAVVGAVSLTAAPIIAGLLFYFGEESRVTVRRARRQRRRGRQERRDRA